MSIASLVLADLAFAACDNPMFSYTRYEKRIAKSLERFPHVRVALRKDWESVVALEHLIFPELETPFSEDCLKFLQEIYEYYLFVALDDGIIAGYLSMMPLNELGVQRCFSNSVTNVCSLPKSEFSAEFLGLAGLFIEVIAFREFTSLRVRRGLLQVLLETMEFFSLLPIFATPVSIVGHNVMEARGFEEVACKGLNRLSVLRPAARAK